jgi:hypothetical protein
VGYRVPLLAKTPLWATENLSREWHQSTSRFLKAAFGCRPKWIRS